MLLMVFLCYPSLVFHFFYLTLTLGSKMWHRHLVYYMYCMQVNLYSWQDLVHSNRYSAPNLVSNFWNGQNSNFVGVSGANIDFMNIKPSKLFKYWFWLIIKSELWILTDFEKLKFQFWSKLVIQNCPFLVFEIVI